MANLTTFYCHGMPISDEQAVELFKNLDIVVMCRDGSKWLNGERYDEFAHLQMTVARVKELIADKEQPTYPEHLQTLTPEQKSVYTLGEWGGQRKEKTMLTNKQLAGELITRYGGVPRPFRTFILEAARRLLQMAPEHEFKVPQEADSLRELAAEWPVPNKPWITSDEWLCLVCTAAADRIEQMAETIEYARKIQAERDAMAAALKNAHGCDGCAHRNCAFDMEPCVSCLKDGKYSKWTWKGA